MSLAYGILASLDFQAMSGYELKKFFDRSIGNFWSTTQSHIYKALEDLERQGWVEMHLVAQEDRPNRKEYVLTGPGRAELRRWLTTPLPPTPVRESWLIQLFFSHTSSDAEIEALARARGETNRQVLEPYRSQTRSAVPQDLPPGLQRAAALWQLTLDYGIAYYEFEQHWNEEMLERVKHLPPQLEPSTLEEKTR
jgi:PadR family transcriptional regulator, regulatory protein AphA